MILPGNPFVRVMECDMPARLFAIAQLDLWNESTHQCLSACRPDNLNHAGSKVSKFCDAMYLLCLLQDHTTFSNEVSGMIPGWRCGERGIRTLVTLAGKTVFETVPFNHSGISPLANVSNYPFRFAVIALLSPSVSNGCIPNSAFRAISVMERI